MKIATKTLDLGIASDIYSAGFTTDGDEFIAERYFICAEDKDGNRYEIGGFNGAKKVFDDEEGEVHFQDTREEGKAAANRLLVRIQEAGVINTDFWREGRPVYGSKAYCQYGQDDDIAWEKKFAA